MDFPSVSLSSSSCPVPVFISLSSLVLFHLLFLLCSPHHSSFIIQSFLASFTHLEQVRSHLFLLPSISHTDGVSHTHTQRRRETNGLASVDMVTGRGPVLLCVCIVSYTPIRPLYCERNPPVEVTLTAVSCTRLSDSAS